MLKLGESSYVLVIGVVRLCLLVWDAIHLKSIVVAPYCSALSVRILTIFSVNHSTTKVGYSFQTKYAPFSKKRSGGIGRRDM